MHARPIVVGYDASPDARAALRWALDEADRESLPVKLVHAFDWYVGPALFAPGPSRWPDTEARADIKAMLEFAADDARRTHPGVAVSTEVMDGPAQVCLRDVSADASTVVLGGRGTGGFAELLIGSTAVAVSTRAHCPVVVVRAGAGEASGDVVVGFDGSPCAHLALRYAFERAAATRAPLRIIQTWQPPPTRYYLETVDHDIRVDLDRLAADGKQQFPEVSVSTELHVGGAAAHLVAASADARLVVVGSRGRGTIGGAFLGSVGQELIHHAHCPVAIVREVPASQVVPV
ncbi:universal stress protein [Asanoa iriomotensis]|uniref:Universal stress protein n=1 Tax=Asanoa iriomotensis TaxID=234613 RepID=A0ABQ4CDW7_9ACTN|nr:universal stress protein [Asanoa iriomotensis]GIF60964.1 universal stress protein [Asanoa iriomotensis]